MPSSRWWRRRSISTWTRPNWCGSSGNASDKPTTTPDFMDTCIIETKNVFRSFGGSIAVRNLNLCVRRGSIYGFLGRNGAGKTTTIKMLAGLIWPDAGEIRVNGVEPAKFSVADRWKIGYVSERQILPPGMRVAALIQFT